MALPGEGFDMCPVCFVLKVGGVCRVCSPTEADKVNIKTTTSSEDVRKIALAFHSVCSEHDSNPADLLTAIVWTAVSACKSFDCSEESFVANFRKLMKTTGELVDEPMLIRGGR